MLNFVKVGPIRLPIILLPSKGPVNRGKDN